MNLANRLTMLRIVLAVAVFLALMRASHALALILFLAAITTDWIDGYVARRTNTTSAFGKVADPIADKILVLGTLLALIKTKELHIPAWGVFLIVARELLIGGIRTLAGAQGKLLVAERWGKWKMGVQSVSVLLMIAILVLADAFPQVPSWLLRAPYYLTVLSVVVTWSSAILYYRQNRKMLQSSWG